MKKLFFSAIAVVSMASAMTFFASCKGNEAKENCFPKQINITENIGGVKDVTFIEVDDYDFDSLVAIGATMAKGACSEARKGDYVMRNLDWNQYDQATYVVKVAAKEGRNASLAVCGMNDNVKHGKSLKGVDPALMNFMMASCLDGMNDKGVYIGVNVVPFQEMIENKSGEQDLLDYKAPEDSPYASRGPLLTAILNRYILDNATSLENARELIEGTSWYEMPANKAMGFKFHWLVATKEGSFVCEFIDDKPQFIFAESTTSCDYGNVMTNFSNYLMSKYQRLQKEGEGYERFEIIKSLYDKAEGIEGAKQMSEATFFSKAYTRDFNDPFFPWSDFASKKHEAKDLMALKDPSKRVKGNPTWDIFSEEYNGYLKIWNWREMGWDYNKERTSWFTAHSSIWNLAEKSVILDVEEQDLFKVKINFDGTIESLDSSK